DPPPVSSELLRPRRARLVSRPHCPRPTCHPCRKPRRLPDRRRTRAPGFRQRRAALICRPERPNHTMTVATELELQAFVLLRLGDRRFALAAHHIAELVAPSRIFRFPHRTPKVEGVIL